MKMLILAALLGVSVLPSVEGRERVRSVEHAEEATVLHVAVADIAPPRRQGMNRDRGAELVGGLVGAAIGYQATRNRSNGSRAAAMAAGGALGAAAGNRYAERRRYGFDVLLEVQNSRGRTRTVSLFTETDPGVLPGDRVYLVGRDRLVRVPVGMRDERL